MRLFYLEKRNNVYCVSFKNPRTGKKLTAKSTGKTNKGEAALVAMKWLSVGIPEARTGIKKDPLTVFEIDSLIYHIKNTDLSVNDADRIVNALKDKGFIQDVVKKGIETDLLSYLYDFWNFEQSDYIKEKISHGHRISITRSIDMIGAVKNHWEPFFGKINLSEITKKHLRGFSLYVADKGLAAKTINNILSAGFIAIKWAYENGMINENPSVGIMKFSGKSRKRGILTDKEVKKLFTVGIWKDERCRLANLLACQTGLRAGEITALRVKDIEGNKLHVRHSYNIVEHKLKSTKTGEERIVPLLPEMKNQLLSLAETSPDGFYTLTVLSSFLMLQKVNLFM